MTIDETEVTAFVDGELDTAGAARIEAAMASDQALRGEVERHRRLRDAAHLAFADILGETPPAALIDAIKAGSKPAEVVDLDAARAARAKSAVARPSVARFWQAGAIAATLVIGVAVGRMIGVNPAPNAAAGGGLLAADPALSQALGAVGPASPGAVTRVGFSFRNHAGEYCRTFQTRRDQAVSGVACHDDQRWSVRVAAAGPATPAAGAYRMAASDTPPAVLAAVDAMIDGGSLDAKAEAEARKLDWRPRR